MAVPTFILTLRLDEATFVRLDALRRRHFPAALNQIPAHLTLFHRLQGEPGEALCGAARVPPLCLSFSGVRSLGRGVALAVESARLLELRSRLACVFAAELTPQDRQGYRPHVTIQNKVTPHLARDLHDEMTTTFQPFGGQGEGLLLWRYLGGPWRLEAAFPFSG